MPIRPPALDDRGFDDLVAELTARIPAHTPEWTHPRPGDPGMTLVELFAWLADTILYRANLIPERQRLAFLRLLGMPMRAAQPARGLISVTIDARDSAPVVKLPPFSGISKPLAFETLDELTVLPVTAQAYYKRRLDAAEQKQFAQLLPDLGQVYELSGTPVGYVTTPVFIDNAAEARGFDLVGEALDQCLWLALLAPKAELVDAARAALGADSEGRRQLLNVGIAPALTVPALFEDIGPRARLPHLWEVSTGREDGGEADYLTLEVIEDRSAGLTQNGVQRLLLPGAGDIGVPANDVRVQLKAGVGDRPPRIDDPATAERLVTWLRLRPDPKAKLAALQLSWLGINAAAIDQRQTIAGRVLGVSSGAADQEFALAATAIEADSLQLQVEETGLGYRLWQRVDDLALHGRDAAVYSLDAEAGSVRFGDGVRGRIPEAGRSIRVASMRAGGGAAGNLPAGSLTLLDGLGAARSTPPVKLKLQQPLALTDGADAETLAQAEQRIPATFRHRDRAVTESDYQELAARTPGVAVGRVELLPRFKPQQRRFEVPGVVSVLVLPQREGFDAPYPRADRPFLESVHGWLDARRPLATELYTIGCEYVPLALSVAVSLRDGAAREATLNAVREALRRYLWPLAPGGIDGRGWALGRSVQDRELEVVVARVDGVDGVAPLKLFRMNDGRWQLLARDALDRSKLELLPWQLPELLGLVVDEAEVAADTLAVPASVAAGGIAVPVVPEVC